MILRKFENGNVIKVEAINMYDDQFSAFSSRLADTNCNNEITIAVCSTIVKIQHM